MSTIYLSEKKEYRALDFSKFVAAFLVAAIHIPPFEEIAPVFSHEFQQVICRMAVPFFFVCTGYFIGEKITDKDRVKKYLFHIIKMYVWWSLLYLIPIIDRFWEKKKKSCRKHIRTCKKIFPDRILHTALVSACDCCSGAVFVSVGNTFSVECERNRCSGCAVVSDWSFPQYLPSCIRYRFTGCE